MYNRYLRQVAALSAICGVFYSDYSSETVEHGMTLMKALEQFPSDDSQTWHNNSLFLGCHTQWITPESIGDGLPRYSADKQLAITADAILDNRQELFDKLQVNCYLRNQMTDSELLLLAYLKWGEESPKHLLGDFAFMIWDERNQILFGARDFSGARTLYYYNDTSRFAFCTAISPLLELPFVENGLNELWLAEFLTIPSMIDSADPSTTVYRRIHQIPPSHSITIHNGKIKKSRYCRVYEGERLRLRSNNEYEEAFRDVFQEAVAARTRSYDEVGSQLSGGIDSSAVVSFAAKVLGRERKRLHTFSFYPVNEFVDWTPAQYAPDERTYVRETVGFVGNITDHYYNFEGSSPLNVLDDALNTMEMPYKFFENYLWLSGIYEKASELGVKVLLSGARGNYSISWGSWSMNIDYYSALLKGLRWNRLNQELTQYCQNYRTGKSVILPVVLKRAFPFLVRGHAPDASYEEQQALINPTFAHKTNVYAKLYEQGMDLTAGVVHRQEDIRRQHFEQLYSWNKSGTANTKLSLRYSLWDRDPTNDLRVIRFCMAVPEEQYVTGGMQRSLIRRSTKDMLPEKVRMNQTVRGIQVADIMHRMAPEWPAFIQEVKQLAQDSAMNDLLNMDVVKQAITKAEHAAPDFIFDESFRILTRSLTLYRFINHISERR